MSFKPIPLTAKQIKFIDEIQVDGFANEETLKVALNFHSNKRNEIEKKNRELWSELSELHDLDIVNNKYKVETYNGTVSIVLNTED